MNKKYLFYDNLVVKTDGISLLINLISQRRRVLSFIESGYVASIQEKLGIEELFTKEEKAFLELLQNEKQVLSNQTVCQLNERAEQVLQYQSPSKVHNINIDITYGCNFACAYCFQRKKKFTAGLMTSEDIKNIDAFLNIIEEKYHILKQIKQITLSGGEPLQASTIDSILSVGEIFQDSKINLKTNGSNLKKYWTEISSLRLNKVQISLDGPSEEQVQKGEFNALNKGTFKNIVDGINLAIDAGCEVIVATVVDKKSVRHLPELEELIIKEGWLERSNFNWSINSVIDFSTDNELDMQHNGISDIFDMNSYIKRNTNLAFYHCNWFDSIYYLIKSIRRNTAKPTELQSSRCNRTNQVKLAFSPSGAVYYCSCVDQKKGIVGNYKLNEFDFEQYIQYMGVPVFLEEKCKECVYRYVCGGGCRIHSIARNGEGAPFCGAFAIDEIMSRIGELV